MRLIKSKIKKLYSLIFFGGLVWLFYRISRYLRSLFRLSRKKTLGPIIYLDKEEIDKKIKQFNDYFQPSSAYAICAHLYYSELLPEIISSQFVIKIPVDMYISLGSKVDSTFFDMLEKYKGKVHLSQFENRGRDVYPFLKLFPLLIERKYEWVCKLHSKKSPQIRDGELWRIDLLKYLLSLNVLKSLNTAENIILAAPFSILPLGPFIEGNQKKMKDIFDLLEIDDWPYKSYFIAGTMFWFRPKNLEILMKIDADKLFENDSDQIDGTYAHAFERIFYFLISLS